MVSKNPNEYKWRNSTNTDGTGPDADFSLPSPDRGSFNPDVPRDIDFLNKTLSGYLVQLKTEIDDIDTDLGPDGDTDTTYEFVVEDGKLRLKGSDGTESDVEITAGDSGKLTVTIDDDNNTIELDVDLSDYYTQSEVDALIPSLDNYYTKDETYNKNEIDALTPTLPDNIAYTDVRNEFTSGQDYLVDGGEIVNVKKDGTTTLAIWADGKITQENILANTQDKEFVNRKNLTDAIEAIEAPDNIVNLDGNLTRDSIPTDRIVMYVGTNKPSYWAAIAEASVGALFTSSSGEGLWIKEGADADGWVRADDTEYTEHLKGGETNQVLAKASQTEGHYVWKEFKLPDGQEPYPGISNDEGNEIEVRDDGLYVEIPEYELPDGELDLEGYAKLKGGNKFEDFQHFTNDAQFDSNVDFATANFWGNVEYYGWIIEDNHIVNKGFLEERVSELIEEVGNVYDSGWQEINGQNFRRIGYTVYGEGTTDAEIVADLNATIFTPEHPLSFSAHYEQDKTLSNPVYHDGGVLRVNSKNGESVTWSGSWSVSTPIPDQPDSNARINNLSADSTETSVTLTWEVTGANLL